MAIRYFGYAFHPRLYLGRHFHVNAGVLQDVNLTPSLSLINHHFSSQNNNSLFI